MLTSHHKEWYGIRKDHWDTREATPEGCAKEVKTYAGDIRQCRMKRGHGPENAFCKAHAKRMEI